MALDFNPYKVLKVDPTADLEIVTAVYRALSKKYHPDVNKSPDAQGRMQQINRAYDMLKDPSERAKVDAELSRSSSTSSSSTSSTGSGYSGSASRYSTPGSASSGSTGSSYTSSRPSSSTSTHSNSNPFARYEKWRASQQSRRSDQEANGPEDDSYYLYQKRLVDDIKKKVFRVSVYQDKVLGGKVCSIFCSANKNGTLNSGSVYLKSPELFDLINDVEDAMQHVEASGQPIEMLSDHDVFFRRHVAGLNNTFIGVEIIKHAREDSKEGLFLIGEKGRSSGVISEQTARQLAQIERILKEALSAMR